MKNRSEIGYLTILGLSLTVVLSLCKDDKVIRPGAALVNSIVKSNKMQAVPASLSSAFNNPVFLSSNGSYFFFADSCLFTNAFMADDDKHDSLQLNRFILLTNRMLLSGKINVHILSFNSGSFTEFRDPATEKVISHLKYFALSSEFSSLLVLSNLSDNGPGQIYGAAGQSVYSTAPSRAGPFIC